MSGWEDIAAVLEARGRQLCSRDGSLRCWAVPSPTGGTFRVEVTLRPRWCSAAIDRWNTTDRAREPSRAWHQAHTWPVVRQAITQHGGHGDLPSGGRTFDCARPLPREALTGLLAEWVDAELGWGVKR